MTWQPSRLEKERLEKAERLQERDIELYPRRIKRTHTSAQAITAFEQLEEQNPDSANGQLEVTVTGRIRRANIKGKVSFMHIVVIQRVDQQRIGIGCCGTRSADRGAQQMGLGISSSIFREVDQDGCILCCKCPQNTSQCILNTLFGPGYYFPRQPRISFFGNVFR